MKQHLVHLKHGPTTGQRGNTPTQNGSDTPVFDRGYMETTVTGGSLPHMSFTRTDRDRRPGRPLPPEMTGDPHPDRLARAKALRLAILERDRRLKIEGSVDRLDLTGNPGGYGTPKRRGGAHARSKTPDIPTPRSYYVDIPRETAAFEARRDDAVLLFPTLSEAARCLTGAMDPKHVKAIQNASGGVTKSAFGWEWTRLKSRRGANR